MKQFITLLLTLILGGTYNAYSQSDSISHNGLQRYYKVHLPVDYTPQGTYPLVLALHGGFGSGPQLENQSQLSNKADEESFIVVYPDGVKSPIGIRTWNAGECCGYARDQNIDDVGFLSSLIDTLFFAYPIDSNKVYFTGMSNGGFMSYRLACEIPKRIAAIAPVACSMNMACDPESPVSIMHFHSYKDSNVPYDGGIGDGVSKHYNPPLDSVLQVWTSMSSCSEYQLGGELNRFDDYSWTSCDCNTEYSLLLTKDGGHSWPGGKKSLIGDSTSQFISANDLMWAFFEKHERCDKTVGIKEIAKMSSSVYPNPAQSTIRIDGLINGVTITSATGTIVANPFVQQYGTTAEIDISNLTPGLYFVAMQINGNRIVQSIVKNQP